jgi:hypothetical protein
VSRELEKKRPRTGALESPGEPQQSSSQLEAMRILRIYGIREEKKVACVKKLSSNLTS